ncbi:HpcH/HpaI aldolase/citrate lyase family protein [Szabonella alba]|uniref:CoA ester lyase n=1 Tax=Szabonella alba TaxID=2804194 RepID=A0A8K0V7U5_9RHOB|nr:CoA ester lyase [Szabonella alba]MBL4916736.1 CoA ester lyase [Szabonella alba]
MTVTRPIRSWLFAPGMDARKMEKALASDADALILDIEDAVALSEKPKAREMVRALSAQISPERQVFVRVNDLMTGMTAEDIRAACAGGIAGIILPKAESAEMIRIASALVDEASRAAGVPQGQIRIGAILESARGVLRAEEIGSAGGRLETLMFGAGDFTNDIGIPTSNVGEHIINGKLQTVLACRSNGLRPPIDTVFFDVTDPDGFAADCRQGRDFGFQGKAVIHPTQIAVANDAYSPSATDIAFATQVVDSFTRAEAEGVGAIRVEGKLVDYAMVKNSRKLLDTARALGLA